MKRIEAKSKEYERSLVAAIKRYSKGSVAEKLIHVSNVPLTAEEFEVYGKSKDDIKAYISASAAAMNQSFSPVDSSSPDSLHSRIFNISSSDMALTYCDLSTFAPPISLTPLLSFCPIFSAQARLINSSCVRLFFKEHGLRLHLSLQRQFHLFGDGVFISRLSHALFDPELETAERRQGVARSGGVMGLNLGNRDSWPPASSELRLALMGVLADSYYATANDGQEHKGGYLSRESELPGGLSFAIRELSQDELEKCMDPHSIEALDFLRLQYKPPSPLDVIITPVSLQKYDRLFKLLLRMTRMLYVVTQLFRDATSRSVPKSHAIDPLTQKFRVEARHFVTSVSSYFFEVCVDTTWAKFEAKLDEIERRINANDTDIGQLESLDRLREYHERVLDRMMFAALLRKRQEQVMKLLEDIFTIILTFARYSRTQALGFQQRSKGDSEETRSLYLRFRKRVSVFVTVCRGLSAKHGYGHKSSGDGSAATELFGSDALKQEGGNTIGFLLLKLEMSGYYSRPVWGME
jgi:Gamma tubulin complex component C-terminal